MDVLSIAAAASIPVAVAYAAWRRALLSLTFAVAMLTTFALGVVATRVDPFGGLPRFWFDLAVVRSGPVHSGPLTYVTMLFLHAGLAHLLFNLIFLVFLGPLLEERIGSLRWGVLFFAGGIVATLVFEVLHSGDAGYVLMGASGALSAVFGAFGRLYPYERISMWVPIPLPAMPVIYYVIGFIIVQLLLSVVTVGTGLGQVAWEAHVAGIVFGFAAAPLAMRLPGRLKRVERARDFSILKPLVQGPELTEAYEHLAHETLPDAQAAWLERFAAKASCPRCGKLLAYRRGSLRSECGWSLRLP